MCVTDAIGAQLHPDNLVVMRETADPEEYQPARGRFRRGAGIPTTFRSPVRRDADTWKGYDVLLDAFEIAKQADPRLHLVVAGVPSPGRSGCSTHSRPAPRRCRTCAGSAPDDIADVLADLDGFVLPSTEPEPYGLVAVEALACGVPGDRHRCRRAAEIAAGRRPRKRDARGPRDAAALARAIGERFSGLTGLDTAAAAPDPTPKGRASDSPKCFARPPPPAAGEESGLTAGRLEASFRCVIRGIPGDERTCDARRNRSNDHGTESGGSDESKQPLVCAGPQPRGSPPTSVTANPCRRTALSPRCRPELRR
jgi:hypothetical protein